MINDLSLGNHTIAIVKAPEKYESLKSALANVIKDVNQLSDAGWIEVDGKRLNLEFFSWRRLQGMKFEQ